MKDEDFATYGLQPPPARIDPPNSPRDVAEILDRAIASAPDAEALVEASQRMTFAQVGSAVESVTTLFEQAGLKPGDRIAASLGNTCDLVIAFFAAMRLGAVWVGINKILPAGDKRYILDHSGAKLLLADASIAEQIDSLRGELSALAHVWVIDEPARDGGWHAARTMESQARASRPPVDPYAPAAIMYTSGTTGVPKGVVHSQHNMVVVPAATFAHGILSPDASRGAALPLTITNVMILGPISAFFAIRPFKFGPSTKVAPLVEWLHAEQIGQIAFVPTMVYDLLQAGLDLPPGLSLGAGGAPLPQVIREAFFKRYGFHIGTSYGLTEAPTVVAISGDQVTPDGASGLAVPHMDVTIRSEDGLVLPIGETGEVCFGPVSEGPWAGVYTPPLGYWREPERTAALLRGGVVHSGDHGRLNDEGWLTIADRSSELILRGGSNVYPAEIERILHRHDDVADCAVVGRPDLRMGMLTVACVLPARPGIDADALRDELRALCAEHLTRYKIPDEWRFFEEFPRNAMGKVVKPKLRELVAPTN
ncbi:class I adenylate-forming enzyme family protein [Novosphingobium taihuense]|uniref:Acyl-CoA synthetase (AMP-forming)/AMP-acid ligase II n=1 Tax=Novosphingobium taihuense TaxID=260085 RepID=A0A7W7EXK1_9SPHN|nr:class I adenylate-forming enzyme family protein [Novosphingobium taihuense]MBB4615425.1 acyl-CoA synthetase (AMP-forming)/AMP-acid ligase II [Novosphingobium taihuense]TWH82127.1 fatty-acyl-CoA synthase [Novosphingobium taihuense]